MPSAFPDRLSTLAAELKRRRVFRVAIAYVVAAFVALQAADILVPALRLPDWTMTLVVVAAIVGLIPTVILAWAFDITPAGVTRTPAVEARPDAARAAAAAAPRSSVAVMPFRNLGGGADTDAFADGITEDVIATLGQIAALKVIARSSVTHLKDRPDGIRGVGARLGVATVLDGSVRRSGDRVRIVAALVDVASESQIWAETYDRQLVDIFRIQTDVALQIAAALRVELSADESNRVRRKQTANIDAYQAYARGRLWFIRYDHEGLQRAVELYREAIRIDPTYALAHAHLARVYGVLSEFGHMPAREARAAADEPCAEALRLDPDLGEAHCSAAYRKMLWDLDWAGAEASYRRAIELSPSLADAYDLYGRLCAGLARFDQALELQVRARELDPLAHPVDVATTLLRAGRYAEVIDEAGKTLEFDPQNARAHATLGWALFKLGRTDEGLAAIGRAAAISGHANQWRIQLAHARALNGDPAEARALLAQLEQTARAEFVSPYHLAFLHTGLGQHDRAIDLLEQAYEGREGSIYGIKGSFLLEPLRTHPRFQALLVRMNAA